MYHAPANKVKYDSMDTKWVREIVDPWLDRLFTGIELHAKSSNLEHDEICTLYGYAEVPETKGKDKSPFVTTLREVVVYVITAGLGI